MRLFAALVPPREVVDEVVRVVRSVNPPLVERPPQPRSLLQRLSRGSTGGAHAAGRAPVVTQPKSTTEPTTHELEAVSADRLYIPLTSFGNVALGDSVKLADALRAECANWSKPELAFTGGTALEFPGDQSVWVKIAGDVDALNAIGRGVPQAVQRLGFFVDRRKFRPWMAIGAITDTTSAAYLERLVAALEELRGEPWVAEGVSLMKWLPDADNDGFEEMEHMPLA